MNNGTDLTHLTVSNLTPADLATAASLSILDIIQSRLDAGYSVRTGGINSQLGSFAYLGGDATTGFWTNAPADFNFGN